MNIEKLNELQKCLEILKMDDFMTNKEYYIDLIQTVKKGSITPLIESLEQEGDTDSKLFKFIHKLDKNLRNLIVAKIYPLDDEKFYQYRHNVQKWIQLHENELKEILKEYE